MSTELRRPRGRRRAVIAAALVAGVISTAAGASAAPESAPPTAMKVTPSSLNFGTVPLGSASTKPVQIVNRSTDVIYYTGARWPNFGNPAGWAFPYGFWNTSYEPFPCWDIAPKSTCTLQFRFTPYAAGDFNTYFTIGFSTDPYADPNQPYMYSGTTLMRARGIAPAG